MQTDNATRARVTSVLLVLNGILALLAIGLAIQQLGILSAIEGGTVFSKEVLSSHDKTVATVGSLAGLVYIVTGIAFLMWFYRAHRNLARSVGRESLEYGSGWAVGGFFVPILCLARPYQVALELWTWCHRAEGDREPRSPVGLWWSLFLVMSVLGYVALALTREATTMGIIRASTYAMLTQDVVTILCAAVAVHMIRSIQGGTIKVPSGSLAPVAVQVAASLTRCDGCRTEFPSHLYLERSADGRALCADCRAAAT